MATGIHIFGDLPRRWGPATADALPAALAVPLLVALWSLAGPIAAAAGVALAVCGYAGCFRRMRMSETSRPFLEATLATSAGRMARVRSIIADAVSQMARGFADMSALAHEQQGDVRNMIADMKGGGTDPANRPVTVDRLSAEMAATALLLGDIVQVVVGVGKRSMDAYDAVETIGEQMNQVFHLAAEVKKLARHTSLIALNSAVEAARAGEAGRMFNIVAEEVKALAQRSAQVSDEIAVRVSDAEMVLARARTVTESNASQDLSLLLTAKIRVDALSAGIAVLDQNLRERIDSFQQLSDRIGERAGAAIRGLQFEDIARQILESSERELKAALGHLSERRACKPAPPEAAPHSPAQTSVDAGGVEIF